HHGPGRRHGVRPRQQGQERQRLGRHGGGALVIVRKVRDLRGGSREVESTNWVSRRLLLKSDGMGFSLHETIILAGTATRMCYRNHLEAVYCVGGRGSIEVLATGETFDI